MAFDTPLTSDEEARFNRWKMTYAPHDLGTDYDLRGAFKAGLKPDPVTGHWPDTFKKPNHETFSDESIYATLGQPGHWVGDEFHPAMQKYLGNPKNEAVHIQLNQANAQIADLLKKKAVSSGAADKGIQATPIVPLAKRPPIVGKYWSRRLGNESENPLGMLPGIIKRQSVQKQIESMPSQEVFKKITEQTLSTGAFADAFKRTGLAP